MANSEGGWPLCCSRRGQCPRWLSRPHWCSGLSALRRGLPGTCWAEVPLQPGWSERALAELLWGPLSFRLSPRPCHFISYRFAGVLYMPWVRSLGELLTVRAGVPTTCDSSVLFPAHGALLPCLRSCFLLERGLVEHSRPSPWLFSQTCGLLWLVVRRRGQGALPPPSCTFRRCPAPSRRRCYSRASVHPPHCCSSVFLLPAACMSFPVTTAVPAASQPSPASQTALFFSRFPRHTQTGES